MKKIIENTKKRIKNTEIIDIIIFLTIIIIFGMVLLAFYPGLLTSDSVDQLKQAKTQVYSGGHPIFHTFVIGNIAKIFGSASASAFFQILIFAIVWTWGCKVIRKDNSTNLNKVIQEIFTILICIMPINFMYSITLWKDILYSYSIFAACICIYIGIKNEFKFTTLQIIILTLSSVSIMKFRHNGVPIGFFIFICMALFNLIKVRKIKITSIFIISYICIYILTSIPGWMYLKKQPGTGAVAGVMTSTKIYCMGKLLNSDIELETNEIKTLNKILDIENWKKSYNEYSGNAILFNEDIKLKSINQDVLNDFNKIFDKYAKQKPGLIIEHFVLINSIWWSPKELAPMNSVITNNGSISEMSNGEYDNKPLFNGLNNKIFDYIVFTLSHKKIYTFLYRPAIPFIISIIGILYIVVKRKNIGYILLVLPMLLNIGTYVFIFSSQDHRYFYPINMVCYFIILILISMFAKVEIKERHNKNNKINKKLIVIPFNNDVSITNKNIEKIKKQNIKEVDILLIKDNLIDNIKVENVDVINVPDEYGINGMLKTECYYAYNNGYDAVVQIENSEEFNVKTVIKMIDLLNDNIDMIIKDNKEQSIFKRIINKLNSIIINIFLSEKYNNLTFEYIAINKEVMKEINKEISFDSSNISKMLKIRKHGNKIIEI